MGPVADQSSGDAAQSRHLRSGLEVVGGNDRGPGVLGHAVLDVKELEWVANYTEEGMIQEQVEQGADTSGDGPSS